MLKKLWPLESLIYSVPIMTMPTLFKNHRILGAPNHSGACSSLNHRYLPSCTAPLILLRVVGSGCTPSQATWGTIQSYNITPWMECQSIIHSYTMANLETIQKSDHVVYTTRLDKSEYPEVTRQSWGEHTKSMHITQARDEI